MGGQEGAGENPYPRVLMGSIAHFRQAMLDADHYQKLNAYYEAHGGMQPPFDPALKALLAARTKTLAVWWESNTRDEIHRALDLADEFGTTAVIVGGREAAKVADRLKSAKVPVVLRLNFPEEPRVPTEQEYRKKAAAERDEPLRVLADRKAKWKEQVATAAALAKAGVPFAFATEGIERIDSLPGGRPPAHHRRALRRRRPGRAHQERRRIAGVDSRLGTLEPGKLGHLIAMTAPFNEEKAKVKYVLIDGLKFEIKPEDRARTKSRAGGRTAWLPPANPASARAVAAAAGPAAVPARRRRKARAGRAKRRAGPADQKAKARAGKKTADDKDPGTAKTSPRMPVQERTGDGGQGRGSKTPDSGKTESQSKPKEAPKTAEPSPTLPNREPQERLPPSRRRLRSSMCRPSSTTTASRRFTPAATCSSRVPRS